MTGTSTAATTAATRPSLATALPPGPRRTAVATTASLAVAVVVFRFGLPEGAPNGVLISGAVTGARAALLAAGLILVYRSARIINFAQAVLGAVGANAVFNLAAIMGAPFPLAFVVGVVLGAAFGALTELLFVRRFFRAPRLVLTVVTVVMTPTVASFPSMIDKLPFWPRTPRAEELRLSGEYHGMFGGLRLEVFPLTFGFPEILTVVLSVAAFVALAAFFRFSSLGAAIRGTAENADRALMLGINVGLLSTLVWTMAGVLSALAAITQGLSTQFTNVGGQPSALIPALAAAVLARMRSLPVTITAAVGIGMAQAAFAWSFPRSTTFDVALFLVITVGLLLQRRRFSRVDEGFASSWKATEELRPTPKELASVPGVRRARRALIGAALVAVVVYPFAFSPSQVGLASLIAINALVALSLVVLTGWGGQVSLGQFALVGVAAVIGTKLGSGIGVPFWLTLPLTSALTAGFAAAVGLPALRLRGAYLAVTTLSFAVVVEKFLFDESVFGWLLTDTIERPRLFFLSFASERSFYFLSVTVAAVAAVVVRRLRSGRPGRVLIALREDELGVQTFAIDAARTRLSVFALSGALAGVAGVLFAYHQRSLDAQLFTTSRSIDMFILAMIGGVTSVTGALLGATWIGVTSFLIGDQAIRQLSQGVFLLLLLMVAPGGLASLAYNLRDAVLRIVALRRRIVVPSLFADVDPEAVLIQKTVLAPRLDGRGLEALPPGVSYRSPSELYDRTLTPTGGDR